MQTLKKNFPGLVLIADLNWDRALTVVAIAAAVAAGAQLTHL